MVQTIEELAEKRRKWVEANRENGFEAGLKRLLTDLYPDNAHFIYELLQNAEDAHAQEVRFILFEDRIEFEHDGERLFSIQDVDAITSIGFSTKRDDATNIGKFGVGFKAVFAYTDSPEIESGGFHFRIRDMVVPESDSLAEHISTNRQTRFILPFDNPKKPSGQARIEIEKLLKTLDKTTLLFLTHIRKIEYLLPDSSLGYIERIDLGDSRFEISVQQPGELAESSTLFLKFDKEVQVEDEETENEDNRLKTCRIAVAFGLSRVEPKTSGKKKQDSSGAEGQTEWTLMPIEPGRVCIYFPADKETSNLSFHLHAPFASTVARDSVRNCAGNDVLRNHIADLLAESMHAIRDQGLLTVQTLALLPNDKDNLSGFYRPFMDRFVKEFKEQDLVPMKRGGHAAASGRFRGQRVLLDLIDDDDLVTLLGDDYHAPMWVANPSQRNQREDNFLSMLEIEEWSVASLVSSVSKMNDEARSAWMEKKDDEWHRDFYEQLADYLSSAPKIPSNAAQDRRHAVAGIGLVRVSNGTYRKGSECYFPTEEVEHDARFPRVAKQVYYSGEDSNKKVRDFLEAVGVREVDEKVEIEYTLKERYSQEAAERESFKPELKDISRFIVFADKHPNSIVIFEDYFIFKLKDGKWGKPRAVYLDAPFLETGLSVYYQICGDQSTHSALSEDYVTCGINPEKTGAFARKVGAITGLSIKENQGYNSIDYTIDHLDDILASKNILASKLVWRTLALQEKSTNFYDKLSRPDGRYNFSLDGDSSIAAALKKEKWVPQKTTGEEFEFIQPRDAVAEKLPEGFEYQTGWQWIRKLEFGQGVEDRKEAQRHEQERQTAEYKRKEEVVRELGFESPEEAEEIARLKKENPEEFRKFEERISARKEHPSFPTRTVSNPERRQEQVKKQISEFPKKEYEERERSVRTTRGAIDPSLWLREQYTNEDDQMVCQICKKEMPFRKRDGQYYFEAVEAFSQDHFPVEHEAQFLALCPLCAAMYKELVKKDEAAMDDLRKALLNMDSLEAPLRLGDLETTIQFVETHLCDVKTILEEMGRSED